MTRTLATGVTFRLVPGYDHFNLIVPARNAISADMLAYAGEASAIQLPPFPPAQ